MMTVRQLEKRWNADQTAGFISELLGGRVEASPRLQAELTGRVALAALMVIRLDELQQPHVPLYGKLVRALIAAQDADGGWRDPLLTALVLRALLCCQGQGLAIERGMTYLAQLQQSDGAWPREPLRRMPADAWVSAYILLQLGSTAQFRQSVRFEAAVEWFESNAEQLDPETARLWSHASLRCRTSRRCAADSQLAMSWS